MIQQRDSFFDFLKAIAIFLVVLGHVQGKGVNPDSLMLRNITVGMNMPLFFMISGYFSKRTVLERNWLRFVSHLSSYFAPLAFFSTVFTLIDVGFSNQGFSNLAFNCVKAFLVNGWFLWALSITYGISFSSNIIAKFVFSRFKVRAFILILVAIYFASFFVVKIWHVPHARSMFPFFALGLLSGEQLRFMRGGLLGLVCLIIYLLVCFFEGDVRSNGMSFYVMNNNFWVLSSDIRLFGLFIARVIHGVMGVIGIIWAADQVQRLAKLPVKVIAILGTETLGVYLLHLWVLDKISDIGIFPVGWPLGISLAIIVVICTHGCTVFLKVHPIAQLLIWGKWRVKTYDAEATSNC